MVDITYKSDFKHDDWIDNEDVVQASGEKGFNNKFHDLEKEFDKLAKVISQINSNLVPVASTNTLIFTPTFLPRDSVSAWVISESKAEASFALGDVEGWMPLQLPDNTKIMKIIIFGSKSETATSRVNSFVFQLYRQPIGGTAGPPLVSRSLVNAPTNPFRVELELTNDNLVDNKNNSYRAVATTSGDSGDARAQISAIQIICSRA
jgi:hypothetical protein